MGSLPLKGHKDPADSSIGSAFVGLHIGKPMEGGLERHPVARAGRSAEPDRREKCYPGHQQAVHSPSSVLFPAPPVKHIQETAARSGRFYKRSATVSPQERSSGILAGCGYRSDAEAIRVTEERLHYFSRTPRG